ncbi:MAG: hypothetical protein KDH09_09570 [Chrysiogenetes bacterium]|nr:hypothetical protein [Chrysiogenetes bacterium]
MIESIGWLGNTLLAVCGAPQAFQSLRQGHSRGVSAGFLWLWLSGELCAGVYAALHLNFDAPILFNIGCNVLFISVIMRYLYWPRANALALADEIPDQTETIKSQT